MMQSTIAVHASSIAPYHDFLNKSERLAFDILDAEGGLKHYDKSYILFQIQ